MHIIARSALISFWQKHPNAQPGLQGWYEQTKQAQWQNFAELRMVFPSADQVKNFTVFNIGGNSYRLIAFVDYTYKKVFIRHVMIHSEYNKEEWKNDIWYS